MLQQTQTLEVWLYQFAFTLVLVWHVTERVAFDATCTLCLCESCHVSLCYHTIDSTLQTVDLCFNISAAAMSCISFDRLYVQCTLTQVERCVRTSLAGVIR